MLVVFFVISVVAFLVVLRGYYYFYEAISKRADALVKDARRSIEINANNEIKNAKKEAEEMVKTMRTEVGESIAKAQQEAGKKVSEIKEILDFQTSVYRDAIANIKTESALLPSVLTWADTIQRYLDTRQVDFLATKRNPAPKASEAVKAAFQESRIWQIKARSLENVIALYEAQAPWLRETREFSVEDISEGLRIQSEEKAGFNTSEDPVKRFVPAVEWSRLTVAERNQLALDRYFEVRQKSAWLAGVMYERYVGSLFEKEGFEVEYRGATEGVNDLGIDLVCKKDNLFQFVQCKRLSLQKGVPVRESSIAQLYGASLVFAHTQGVSPSNCTAILVTTYRLSDEAKKFSKILGVVVREEVPLQKYPSVKCNVSRDGERIYHLPFDQQYDVTKIIKSRGEFYALTVAEAESQGFRRAFRWSGSLN